MKIIITMAGKGSRFRKAGFHCPKQEILAGGKSLFSWSMSSLKNFYEEDFYFIVRKGAYSRKKMAEELDALGIRNYHILPLEKETTGQAATVMAIEAWMNPEDSFFVFNIDTVIKSQFLKREDVLQASGTIPIFYDEGRHWSFVKLDEHKRLITEVAEKRPISHWASIGLYYFERWSEYESAFKKRNKEIKEAYGEVYIAPLYNELIAMGKEIRPVFLPAESYAVLGTPEELTVFEESKQLLFS